MLFTTDLANQKARKVLFTYVVYISYYHLSPDNSCHRSSVRFICGPAVPLKIELPTQVPVGLQLIGATLQSGTHYAVLCCQALIPRGTTYGPYRGVVVQPSDARGRESSFMWEV